MYQRVWTCMIACAWLAGTAGAAGFSIFEQGAAATAEAGAFVARASDPTAIFYNPAGIARQPGGVSVGATLIATKTDFSGDNPFPGVGVTEKMKDGLYYPPHAYLVAPIGPVRLGLGVFAPFGLGTEWPDSFSGRASSTKSVIQTFYFNPVAAIDVTSLGPLRAVSKGVKVSLGAGVQAVYSTVELNRIARQPVATEWRDVAKLHLTGSNGTGDLTYGFNAGAQVEFGSHVTVGASYRSKAAVDYTGTAAFEILDPLAQGGLPHTADVSTTINYPAIMGIGLAVRPFSRLAIEVDVLQMNWSTFDTLGITFDDPLWASLGEKIPELYKNARSYRIGAEYRIDRRLAVRGGYLYDESPSPTEAVSTLLPDANRNSFMVGLGYTMGSTQIDLSYMWLRFLDRSTGGVNRAGYEGLYRSSANLYGLTITQRL